jgi:hypothetical protein
MTVLPALLLAAAGAFAQSEASVRFDAPNAAPLGQPLTVRASAVLPAPAALTLDLQRSATDSFSISAFRPLPSADPLRPVFELTVLPLDLGRRSFPIYWTLSRQGATPQTLASRLELQVSEPADSAQAKDVKDIKQPLRARPPLWPFFLLIAAAAALAIWLKRRGRKASGRPASADCPRDDRPPEIIALAELERLRGSGLWEENRRKEFYGELTEILRRYFERRFGFPATRETSSELQRHLRQLELDRLMLTVFKELFERADLVKFAKAPAADAWGEGDLAAARRLIEGTTPREPAQATGPETSR